MVVDVKEPGFHVKLVAPFAVKVAFCPLQIAVEDEVAVTVGFELTVIAMVFVSEHEPLFPITV